MNDLHCDRIKRWLQSFGLRLSHSRSYRFAFDRENYPALQTTSAPVIFDVGANIGQSTVWYRKSFPHAIVHAFEPVSNIYASLERTVGGMGNVHCVHKALGREDAVLEIPKVESGCIQNVQVLKPHVPNGSPTESITVTTLDSYARSQGVETIHILKTDTEGYDLDVMKGAVHLLSAHKVAYILAEVSILEEDREHTNLFQLRAFLETYGYRLCSFYDLVHDDRGRTSYFNALFSHL